MSPALDWQWLLLAFLTALAAGLGWALGVAVIGRLWR